MRQTCGDVDEEPSSAVVFARFVRGSRGGDEARKEPRRRSEPTASQRMSMPLCSDISGHVLAGRCLCACCPGEASSRRELLRNAEAEEVEVGFRQLVKFTWGRNL